MEPRHGVMGTGLIAKHDGCARARLQPESALLAPLAHECLPLARGGLELVRRCEVSDPPTDQLLGLVAKDGRHATSGANVCLILVDDQHELPRLGPQRGVLIGDEGSDDFERGNMDLVSRRLPFPAALRRPPRRKQLGDRRSSDGVSPSRDGEYDPADEDRTKPAMPLRQWTQA